MWFFNQKRRVREVVLQIAEGLRDGTIVLDPPLTPDSPVQRDEAEALPQEIAEETSLRVLSTSSVAQGMYGSFMVVPATTMPLSQKPKKRGNREGNAGPGFVVVTGGPRQEIVRDSLLQ